MPYLIYGTVQAVRRSLQRQPQKTASKSYKTFWLEVSAVPSEKNIQDARAIFQRFAQEKPVWLPGVGVGPKARKASHRELWLSEESTQAVVDVYKSKRVSFTTT